uniref:Uncharacterized protein n=1 Tax=Rhizophora mucronata TaxID=61149 RepID=A0A2P2N3F0_RHIMU
MSSKNHLNPMSFPVDHQIFQTPKKSRLSYDFLFHIPHNPIIKRDICLIESLFANWSRSNDLEPIH